MFSILLLFLSLSIKVIGIVSLKCINNYFDMFWCFIQALYQNDKFTEEEMHNYRSVKIFMLMTSLTKCQDGCDREGGQERMHHYAGWLRQGPCHHLHQDPEKHQPPEPEESLRLHWHHGPAPGSGGSGLSHILPVTHNITSNNVPMSRKIKNLYQIKLKTI